jgi:hypothetical protein
MMIQVRSHRCERRWQPVSRGHQRRPQCLPVYWVAARLGSEAERRQVTLVAGAKLGPFEIAAAIGAGNGRSLSRSRQAPRPRCSDQNSAAAFNRKCRRQRSSLTEGPCQLWASDGLTGSNPLGLCFGALVLLSRFGMNSWSEAVSSCTLCGKGGAKWSASMGNIPN